MKTSPANFRSCGEASDEIIQVSHRKLCKTEFLGVKVVTRETRGPSACMHSLCLSLHEEEAEHGHCPWECREESKSLVCPAHSAGSLEGVGHMVRNALRAPGGKAVLAAAPMKTV